MPSGSTIQLATDVLVRFEIVAVCPAAKLEKEPVFGRMIPAS